MVQNRLSRSPCTEVSTSDSGALVTCRELDIGVTAYGVLAQGREHGDIVALDAPSIETELGAGLAGLPTSAEGAVQGKHEVVTGLYAVFDMPPICSGS